MAPQVFEPLDFVNESSRFLQDVKLDLGENGLCRIADHGSTYAQAANWTTPTL